MYEGWGVLVRVVSEVRNKASYIISRLTYIGIP
jgi:hypothetical protein